MNKLEKEIKKLSEKIKALETEMKGLKFAAMSQGVPFYNYYEGYLATLWNQLSWVIYEIEHGEPTESLIRALHALKSEIKTLYEILKGTYLERKVYAMLKEIESTERKL